MKALPLALAAAMLALSPAAAKVAKPADQGPAPAASEPPKIQRAETIVDDNWTVTCTQTDQSEGKRACSAMLRIVQADKAGAQHVVFTWVIGHQKIGLASAISVPLGVQIAPGMEVKIGDEEGRNFGYSVCMPDHCEALLPLDESTIRSLSAAQTTVITIRAANGSDAKFTVNMKGFAQALADIGK